MGASDVPSLPDMVEEITTDISDAAVSSSDATDVATIDNVPARVAELAKVSVDAARLWVRLEDRPPPTFDKSPWYEVRMLHWHGKVIDSDEWSLLRTYCFTHKMDSLDKINLTGCATARGGEANEHLAIAALTEALTFDRIPWLKSLDMSSCKIEDADAQILIHTLRTTHAGRNHVEALHLNDNRIGDASVKLLCDGSLPKLDSLELASNQITDDGAVALSLATSETFDRLGRLKMSNNLLTDEGIAALALPLSDKASGLGKVQYLCLDSYDFHFSYLRNAETIVRIGGAPTRLDLAGADDQGKPRAKLSNYDCVLVATLLSVEKVLNKLEILTLHHNDIGAAGMQSLAGAMVCGTSDCFKSVQTLLLTDNPLGDMGLKQLANMLIAHPDVCLPSLRELHIGSCGIGDKGSVKLADGLKAGSVPKLHLLSMAQNQIGDEGCAAIASAVQAGLQPWLTGLYLSKNAVGDVGGKALAAALGADVKKSAPRLKQLYLFGNQLTAEGRVALQAQEKARKGLTIDLE